MNEIKFFRSAHNALEIVFLVFIYVGSFYPHINYGDLQNISELLFLFILMLGVSLHFVLPRQHRKSLKTQDAVNLLRAASLFIYSTYLFIFLVEVKSFFVNGYLYPSGDPYPVGLMQTLGKLCVFPAIIGAILLPLLNLINLLENPSKSRIISTIIMGITLLLNLKFHMRMTLVIGFTLSVLSTQIIPSWCAGSHPQD